MVAGNKMPLKCSGGHPSSSTPASSRHQPPPPHEILQDWRSHGPCVMSYVGANLINLVDAIILLTPIINDATNPSAERDISSLRNDLALITYDDRDALCGVQPVSIHLPTDHDYTLGSMHENVEDVLRHTVPKVTGAAVKAREIHVGSNNTTVKNFFNAMAKNFLVIARCFETCRYEMGKWREVCEVANMVGLVNVRDGILSGVRMLDALEEDDWLMKMRATAGARSLEKILLLFWQPEKATSRVVSWEDTLNNRKMIERALGFSFYQICLVVHELQTLAIQNGRRNHGSIPLVLDHLSRVAATLWIFRESVQRRHAAWTAKEAAVAEITAGVNARFRFLRGNCETLPSPPRPRQSQTDGNPGLEVSKPLQDLMLFAAAELPFAARKLELLSMNSRSDGLFWKPEQVAAKYREEAKFLGNYLRAICRLRNASGSQGNGGGGAAAGADDGGQGGGCDGGRAAA